MNEHDRDVASGPMTVRHGFADRGGWWVVAQFVLMAAVAGLAFWYPGTWINRLVVTWMAGLLFFAGGVFGLAGAFVLGRNRTPFPRPRDGSELVQRGIYARVRHPLYTSVMFLSFGWAVVWQSIPALVAAALLVPFFYAKSNHEERLLREKFPEYANYARQVSRFLPAFRRTAGGL